MDKLLILMITIGIISLFTLGFCASQIYNKYDSINRLTSTNVKNNCNNLSLDMTANCLNNQLKLFFKYNITNLDREMNLSELKELGGVCWHYSQFYYDNIDTTRFFREKIIMDTSNESTHQITIISDKTGYCILDQTNYNCVKLGDSNNIFPLPKGRGIYP